MHQIAQTLAHVVAFLHNNSNRAIVVAAYIEARNGLNNRYLQCHGDARVVAGHTRHDGSAGSLGQPVAIVGLLNNIGVARSPVEGCRGIFRGQRIARLQNVGQRLIVAHGHFDAIIISVVFPHRLCGRCVDRHVGVGDERTRIAAQAQFLGAVGNLYARQHVALH